MSKSDDVELFNLMSPEEQEQYLDMLTDLQSLGSNPTRAQALRALLPHLNHMFGAVYEDFKPELEATYGEELVEAHRELGAGDE